MDLLPVSCSAPDSSLSDSALLISYTMVSPSPLVVENPRLFGQTSKRAASSLSDFSPYVSNGCVLVGMQRPDLTAGHSCGCTSFSYSSRWCSLYWSFYWFFLFCFSSSWIDHWKTVSNDWDTFFELQILLWIEHLKLSHKEMWVMLTLYRSSFQFLVFYQEKERRCVLKLGGMVLYCTFFIWLLSASFGKACSD